MRVIGFNLSKILIERKEKSPDNIQVTQNINIKDVIKEKIPISDSEAIKIEFNFIINYTENFAKLEFEGNVILLPEKDESKNFLKSWKDKKIPDSDKAPLFNFIMNKCNIKALDLEDELGLPFHIPMPRMNLEKD
jgi:hypothetical protein